jgi:hypothetical protein
VSVDQLISKISNLSYELFGTILPGLIFLLFVSLWLVSLGDLLPFVSNDFFPRLNLREASNNLEKIGTRTGIGIATPALVSAYFLGHLLHWISRFGSRNDKNVKSTLRRILLSLLLKAPKPEESYDKYLHPLFEQVLKQFRLPESENIWLTFYPVAKSYLANNNSSSLVFTYQNKYTLHRSITSAAACLFWLCIITTIIGIFISANYCVEPRWTPLMFLTAGSLLIVYGFSSSYAYNWKMFGNSIITETHCQLFPPTSNGK